MFENIQLNNLQLKNCLYRSATWDGLAAPDGSLNEEIYAIYEELAAGGVGLIVTGLTDVSPYDWALSGNMRLCSDLVIPDYKRLPDIVHKYDCRILSQLNINQYFRMERRLVNVSVNEMTKDDIDDVIRLFAEGAVRAQKAGFDGIQLHLAFSWLLNRFSNPAVNKRTDEYGGSTENRAKLVLSILAAIRKATPELHISTKFSFFENEDGSFNYEESVAFCKLLSETGIDSIEIIGGHSVEESNPACEACYAELAMMVKIVCACPIMLTGNNHDITNMAKLHKENGIDLLGMSRPLIREPDLPNRWMSGNKDKSKCRSCGMCYTTYGKRCIFNVKRK